MKLKGSFFLAFCFLIIHMQGQQKYELNSGWQCINIKDINADGEKISQPSFSLKGFMPATVPGTVLTTMLNNKMVPDPFYGMNNEKIPDIYNTGSDYYTYWFVKDFTEKSTSAEEQVWLHFRGINYSCDVFLNGHQLNDKRFYGMFLRQQYNITKWLAKNGKNRLAVIVYPPDPVGNTNGGQGGDGTIAKNVSHQYVAGWDWIQPVRDRNTGIWDKVTIERTGAVKVQNEHVITLVPGKRFVEGKQAPATIKVSAELLNATDKEVRGTLQYSIAGEKISTNASVPPNTNITVQLPDYVLKNPKLWWPNGYGPQNLYHINVQFTRDDGATSDTEPVSFGVREINTVWNTTTRSREVLVNGQKIFIKGCNWIVSDEMLRLSPDRYDAEIRFHRDMNLNLIRVWGGALTERPEFYDACDRYGLLVFQDFWNSGDCNGRWEDPMKKADQWTRRDYPDDHRLFIASAADQIKLIRNHPSLAFWCGGNEITPPEDIFKALKDTLIPSLDGTRTFFDYSNSDSMSFNNLGGNGDGPYGIQKIATFWGTRTFPFNSEVGSVGIGDYESLQRFIPKEDLVPPVYDGRQHHGEGTDNEVWSYHKYISYDSSVYAYGPIKDLRDFANKAQLVNYDQYRALMEGFSAHMWDWYTGAIIWKTQNPWTAMRGQMYDYYLDPNACLYGLHCGSEPLHIMYDPVSGMTMIANNTFRTQRDLMMQVIVTDMAGKTRTLTQQFYEVGPTTAKNYLPIGRGIDRLRASEGLFLTLRLLNTDKQIVSDNLYWLPDSTGNYSGLQHLAPAALEVEAHSDPARTTPGFATARITVTLRNPADGPLAFFNRISLVDPTPKQRLLPTFYS